MTESPRAAPPADPDDETGPLESVIGILRRLGAEAPAIDEQRVWLRVQSAMRGEPQRHSRLPRFAVPGALLVAAPRLALAGALAIALLLGALLGSFLLQSPPSVSAFLDETQRMARASEAAATRGPLSAGDSAALEERALSLLQLASPEVLADLAPTESELAIQRLMEARSALAGVVGENPGDTRALAALAAISGLLEPAASAGLPLAPAPTESATSTAVATLTATAREVATATVTATPTPRVTATAGAAVTATSEPKATATVQVQRTDATRTPESKADDSKGQPPSPETRADASPAVSAAQRVCARVYDLASLGLCKTASATAVAACTEARVASECKASSEAALSAAQQRVQRVGDDCQRLPSSKARNACSEATNRAREISGSGTDGTNGRNGAGQRNESDARGRRD